jgi:phasin
MAAKQDSTTRNTADTAVPDTVRQMAESTLAQAKQAVDKYMQEATRLYGAAEASAEAAQAGARSISQTVLGAAEANIDATFDFARQLVRAKDPQEIVALQQKFLQQQIERMSSQVQEIGGVAKQTATDVGTAARPKG